MTKVKKKSGRKYGAKAAQDVARAVHKMKRGTLRSGGSGKRVTSREQAVAIGLSEARRDGAKMPPQAVSAGKAAKAPRRSKKH